MRDASGKADGGRSGGRACRLRSSPSLSVAAMLFYLSEHHGRYNRNLNLGNSLHCRGILRLIPMGRCLGLLHRWRAAAAPKDTLCESAKPRRISRPAGLIGTFACGAGHSPCVGVQQQCYSNCACRQRLARPPVERGQPMQRGSRDGASTRQRVTPNSCQQRVRRRRCRPFLAAHFADHAVCAAQLPQQCAVPTESIRLP